MSRLNSILIYSALTLNIISCGTQGTANEKAYPNNENITGYNLATPGRISILPDILLEISGLTTLDSTTVACVQDEQGVIFIYNEKKNEIIHRYPFYGDGDYEGIARVGDTMYVLRSDAVLFEIKNYGSPNFTVNSYSTGMPTKDNEGLCYDSDNNRLLIAGKSNAGKSSELKDKRVIYGFDLGTKKLTDTAVFRFDVNEIKDYVIKNKIQFPVNSGQSASTIKFRPAAIAIHPITKNIFLLSANDHLLFIFDRNGNIEHIEPLNPEIYNQPEGITFYENGDILISNEGKGSKPNILYFEYRKK